MEPKQFVDKLMRASVDTNVFNQYSDVCQKHDIKDAYEIRCQNLIKYLEAQLRQSPKILLVGESAGHNGGRRHGLHLLGRDNFSEVGDNLNINLVDPLSTKLPDSATVKIIWNEVYKLNPLPLTFNIFPFHSYPVGNQFANRVPNKDELFGHLNFIDELIKMFKPARIVAIGRVAETGLCRLNIDCDYVRHPSMGGKSKFIQQLRRLL